jgi:hypothetical protein
MNEPPFRGYRDIGGLPGAPVQCAEYGFEDWPLNRLMAAVNRNMLVGTAIHQGTIA